MKKNKHNSFNEAFDLQISQNKQQQDSQSDQDYQPGQYYNNESSSALNSISLLGAPPSAPPDPNISSADLAQENNNLRKKLKILSHRLNYQLDRNKQKQKAQSNVANYIQATSIENQSLQLQNAYKMIERLQKTVKDFQSKQSYQVTLKKTLELESVIKRLQAEAQQLKLQLKYVTKDIKDKDKHISDLNDKRTSNPRQKQEKQQQAKLKKLLKRITLQNQQLKKRELNKHQKLVTMEHKLQELEAQDLSIPGKQEQIQSQIKQYEKKYKQAMIRIQKQNAYISKMNAKVNQSPVQSLNKQMAKLEKSQRKKTTTGNTKRTRNYSQEIGSPKREWKNESITIEKKINDKNMIQDLSEHIPAPLIPTRILRRY